MIIIPGLRIMYIRLSQIGINWGLWNSTIFFANEWNNLDKSVRELKSLDEFKKSIRNATI